MIYQGKTINVSVDKNDIAIMQFDAKSKSVNTFDLETLDELKTSAAALKAMPHLQGLLVKSAKETFIVGADIKQFHKMFSQPQDDIRQAVIDFNKIFSAFEDLPFPTVALIDGACVGGGFELALAADFRIAGPNAKLGLPEVKLGINPGFGGTIRLPRLIGIDNAIEWIATGKDHKPEQALEVGAVDAVVESDELEAAGIHLVQQCAHARLDHLQRRSIKQHAVLLSDMELLMAFTTAKGLVAAQAGPHMPAPVTSVKSMEKSARLDRDDAVLIEAEYFSRLAKTDVANNLVSLFLNEQDLSKRNAALSDKVDSLTNITVLGAGIMGGGIAYQSASKGKKVLMKDIAQEGLDQGMQEAAKLLSKLVDRGRMSVSRMGEVLANITPTLHTAGIEDSDIAIEAVVENLGVKQKVLAETEEKLSSGAVMASNTSTISITRLAENLKRPESFCGMHFFNPVHRMPLVEVIRGQKTTDMTVAKVVKLARDMGKTPIVVNDCAGFYVNRVLFPYLAGFSMLVRDGADFRHVDKVMESFGWPMGPAYLCDVVGLDTACHGASVMAEAYPDRMSGDQKSVVRLLYNQGRLGQKNGKGFYAYELDKKGKPVKKPDDSVDAIIKPCVEKQQDFTDEEIVERMMIPMCLEVVRCLDDGIVSNPVDAEMGLLMGIGFPLFRGGALRYMESVGLQSFLDIVRKYHPLGELYREPLSLVSMAKNERSYFDEGTASSEVSA